MAEERDGKQDQDAPPAGQGRGAGKEDRETVADSPLAGLSDAAVQLIRSAEKHGYVSHDQINSVLPSEELNSKQIEDVLAMFSEMGIVAIPPDMIFGKDRAA
jgi:RNA polymerase primary sigma factor